jgi:hypothetical protein
MSYQFVTEPNLYSDPDSDSSFESAMDAEMTTEQQPPQQNQQQAPQQAPIFDSAVNAFVELRAASMLSNEQFAKVISALKNDNGAAVTTPNDIEDQRIQQRLATLMEFRGDKSDFHMAHRWILAVERDLRAIGLREQQWSMACFRKMPLDSPASLWAESIYGNGGTFCHGVGRDINVQCVLINEMIIIVDHYTLAVRNRR